MSTNDFTDRSRSGDPLRPPLSETEPPRDVTPPQTERLTHVAPRPTGVETDGHHAPEASSSPGAEGESKAREMAHEGQRAAGEVVDSAKQEAAMVAEQARDKAAHLLNEAGADLRVHAADQQRKAASNLRDISDEFRQMLDASQTSGTAATLVDRAAHHAGQAAQWLEEREPADLVDEVKGFARRNPMAFLGIAVGAGLLAGRITRNAGGADTSGRDAGQPAYERRDNVLPRSVPAPPPPTNDVGSMPPNPAGTAGPGTVGGVVGSGVDPAVADPGTPYPPPPPRRSDLE